MVKGLDLFRDYFKGFANQYVLIGGTACSISFEEQDVSFRATKDLDMVLIVEAQSREFGERFWQFIREGGYRNRARSNGNPQFYRFDKPDDARFPAMIELFSRSAGIVADDSVLTPVHIDDDVSSLSAILLNEAYYEMLLKGRDVINGLSVLRPEWLIPFKAKAWLDLKQKTDADSSDVRKHKNDIIRIASEMVLSKVDLPDEAKADMSRFIDEFNVSAADLKSLGIRGVTGEQIKTVLMDTYLK